MARRFRRNGISVEDGSLVDLPEGVFAVLINPKNRELFYAHDVERRGVVIAYPSAAPLRSEEWMGYAYWDPSETFDVDGDEYKRSHSPSSRIRKGRGDGVVLYAALCLKAVGFASAAGIASSDGGQDRSTRSHDADTFWKRCVDNNLAGETEVEAEPEEREHEVDGDDIFNNGCDDTGDDECIDVNDVSGSITITYMAQSSDSIEAQYMNADHVKDAGLVFGVTEKVNEEFPSMYRVSLPPPEVLAGLDLSECRDADLARLILNTIFEAGLDYSFIERAINKLPDSVFNTLEVSKQLRFPFTPNRRYRRNSDVERTLDKVWDAYYGKLATTNFPDFEE